MIYEELELETEAKYWRQRCQLLTNYRIKGNQRRKIRVDRRCYKQVRSLFFTAVEVRRRWGHARATTCRRPATTPTPSWPSDHLIPVPWSLSLHQINPISSMAHHARYRQCTHSHRQHFDLLTSIQYFTNLMLNGTLTFAKNQWIGANYSAWMGFLLGCAKNDGWFQRGDKAVHAEVRQKHRVTLETGRVLLGETGPVLPVDGLDKKRRHDTWQWQPLFLYVSIGDQSFNILCGLFSSVSNSLQRTCNHANISRHSSLILMSIHVDYRPLGRHYHKQFFYWLLFHHTHKLQDAPLLESL